MPFLLAMAEIRIAEHFAEVAVPYEVVLCDIWGVIHNGVRPFAPAVQCLEALRAAGKRVVLISNSPRPAAEIPPQFDAIGVSRGVFDAIVTSGDATRAVIGERAGAGIIRVHHIGPERDLPLFEGLPVTFVPREAAELVVCSGLVEDDHETPAHYEETLVAIAREGTPFLCANPDIVVQKGDRLIYCAGALAERVEALGHAVIYPGKPHPPIYKLALDIAGGLLGQPAEKGRVLAVGDGLKTDLLGAERFGIPSLYVLDGIDAGRFLVAGKVDAAAVTRACAAAGVSPIAAMAALVF